MVASKTRLFRLSLGVKLSLFVAVLVLAVSASMAYFLVIRSAEFREAASQRRFKSLATIIASMRGQGYGGRQYDPMLVKMFVDLGVKFGTHLCFAVFQDAEGRIEGGSLNLRLLAEAAPLLHSGLKNRDDTEQLAHVAQWRWTDESVKSYKVKL